LRDLFLFNLTPKRDHHQHVKANPKYHSLGYFTEKTCRKRVRDETQSHNYQFTGSRTGKEHARKTISLRGGSSPYSQTDKKEREMGGQREEKTTG